MSTRFYYQETSVKPLTLHAQVALLSHKGYKPQRIQIHHGGITTAWPFTFDPHKSELIESH